MFLGTPQQGIQGAELGVLVANIASIFMSTKTAIVKDLCKDSTWLLDQQTAFLNIAEDFEMKYFYETYETPLFLGKTKLVRLQIHLT